MRAVSIIGILFCTLLAQTYPNLASFTAYCNYKQPKNNQSIDFSDFRSIKSTLRLHRVHQNQIKKNSKNITDHPSSVAKCSSNKRETLENKVVDRQFAALEHALINNYDTYNRQERLNALQNTRSAGGSRTKRIIPVDQKVYGYAREYEIPESAFAQRAMNAYEYQLHKEFLEQLTQAQHLKPLYNSTREYTVFLDMVGHSVAFGMQANQQNQAATTTYWSDVAWKSLDLASAVGEGLALGVYNTAACVGKIVSHPVESIQVVGHGVASVVTMLAQGTGTILKWSSFAYGATADKHAELRYYEQLDAELDAFVDQIDSVIDRCSYHLAQMPLREKVKQVTAFGAELIIPGKAFKVIHNLCSRMKPLAIGLFHALRDEQKAVQIAARVEGITETIGMRVIEGAQEVAATSKVVLSEAQLLLQNFHVDLMRKLQPEIAGLRVLFDNKVKGFGEFANKYLKIDYEHILGMDLRFSKRGVPQIGGFHHDLMGTVKKSNIFEFVDPVIHVSGTYKAKLFHKGNFVKEITFFPEHWSREKVVSAVHQAYDNFIISGAIPKISPEGKYIIKGFTKEGIEIEMFITQKGKLTTAYPIL